MVALALISRRELDRRDGAVKKICHPATPAIVITAAS
jgi:hypothetical protein